MELTTLAVECEDGVATVTLDRPEVHNAFDPTMVDELAATWRALRDDDEVRAIVVTGRGEKAFCTGIDRGSVEEFVYGSRSSPRSTAWRAAARSTSSARRT
jgi:enoyl-CoA hydratase/carnithine racemase